MTSDTMNLPPIPKHPDPMNEWNREELCAIQSYGELCVKEYKISCARNLKNTPKFSPEVVEWIREKHREYNVTYKWMNKHHPMSPSTFYDIILKRRAYK